MVSTLHATTSVELLSPLVELIQRTTGLDENQAKTVAYFALATHGLPKLQKFPILTVYGPAGTGKTTLLTVLQQVVYEPVWLDGKVSKAELRDSLGLDTTALIDEADNVYEQWLVNRFSRQSATTSVKREREKGWEREPLNLFGATALNRRRPFRDPAILSRSIVVTTKLNRDGVQAFHEDVFKPLRQGLVEMAKDIEWEAANEYAEAGRTNDAWEPLLWAAPLNDRTWQKYADSEKKKATAHLAASQEEEPTQAVYQALLALALQNNNNKPHDRVLLSDLVAKVVSLRLNSWQVGQLLRDLGFETKKAGGLQYAYSGGTDKLVSVGRELRIQDEWLEAQGG